MNDTTTRGDISINGMGMVATGAYRAVTINGSGTLTGDIECEKLKVNGSSDGRGSLKAGSIGIAGSMQFGGDVEAGSVKVSGTGDFGGSVKAAALKVSGTANVGSDFSGDNVDVQGVLRVHGDCEAERFTAQGAFTIGGLLNAGVVDVRLYGACSAREIGGEAITVRYAPFPLRRLVEVFLSAHESRLTVDTVEGDHVRLEKTTARVVRGTTVVAGPGCEIGLVEYAESFEKASDAKVKSSRKTGEAAEGREAGRPETERPPEP